jgi:hypothetical protein
MERRNLRGPQLQDQHSNEDGEYAIGKRAQSLGGRLTEHPCLRNRI